MVVQLTPDQVAEHWHLLSDGFEKALPSIKGSSEMRMTHLLNSAIAGKLQVWELLKNDELESAALTTITRDIGTGELSLLIYAMFSNGNTSKDDWKDGIHVLRQFAKVNRCSFVSAFTDNPAIVSIVTNSGWKVNTRYVYESL